MFALFERLRQLTRIGMRGPAALATLLAQRPNTPPTHQSGNDADELTPASWPTVQRSAEIFRWGGGCCG